MDKVILPLHQLIKQEEMAALAGVRLSEVPLEDAMTLNAFHKYEIDENGVSGLGVYKCDAPRLRDLSCYLCPSSFHELFEMFGCVWSFSEAEYQVIKRYVTEGRLPFCDIPVSQEDLCLFLRKLGADDQLSMGIAYQISQREKLCDDYIDALAKLGIPDWFMAYCRDMNVNIPPKAIGVELVKRAYISAWFKIHQPAAFYTVFCKYALRSGYLRGIQDLSDDAYLLDEYERRKDGIEDTPLLTLKTLTELIKRDRDRTIRANVRTLSL